MCPSGCHHPIPPPMKFTYSTLKFLPAGAAELRWVVSHHRLRPPLYHRGTTALWWTGKELLSLFLDCQSKHSRCMPCQHAHARMWGGEGRGDESWHIRKNNGKCTLRTNQIYSQKTPSQLARMLLSLTGWEWGRLNPGTVFEVYIHTAIAYSVRRKLTQKPVRFISQPLQTSTELSIYWQIDWMVHDTHTCSVVHTLRLFTIKTFWQRQISYDRDWLHNWCDHNCMLKCS